MIEVTILPEIWVPSLLGLDGRHRLGDALQCSSARGEGPPLFYKLSYNFL